LQLRQTQFNLRPATKPSAMLKVLRGNVPVEILAQRKPLLAVKDIFSDKIKLYKGAGDLELALLNVQDNSGGARNNGNIRFFMSGVDFSQAGGFNPGFPNVNMLQQRFELTDAQGRRFNLNVNVNFNGNNQKSVEGNMYFNAVGGVGPAARLTYNSQKTIRTSVPFEFKNVPMP
jgi:hypothetical protein